MEKINFNKSNNTAKEEIEELFYGSNYINNLNNIFSNNKSKIKTLNKKEKEDTFKELEKNLKLIIGDKKIILREEFIEFHFNIFWIMPEFQIAHFRRQLPLMWGIKKI